MDGLGEEEEQNRRKEVWINGGALIGIWNQQTRTRISYLWSHLFVCLMLDQTICFANKSITVRMCANM